MTTLPITHMTLYKHGVGYFERRAELDGEEVTLTFDKEDMNDVLKSLTVIDRGQGQVLGIDYATPQSREEQLAGNSIRLDNGRSLRDLLVGLRGRKVRLLLEQNESYVGILVGLDELPERQAVADSPVSLLVEGEDRVQTVRLGRIEGVEILDDQAAADLRFFLRTAIDEGDYRQVRIRLTSGAHDLAVNYVAPAPTWRVSYRLVADPETEKALLLGWGIFDNRLEEDLEGVSLALVAGMPISFVYDLVTPFTPKRPEIEEEARTTAGPVEFERARYEAQAMAPPEAARMESVGAMPAPAAKRARQEISPDALRDAAAVDVSTESLGELFQYRVATPVSVGRGQSAMVPIVSSDLDYRKELLYNAQKLPHHPVASLRLNNDSGLTLERGPITVYEGGEYVGEAILPFTSADAEFVVPYAVELNVKVREEFFSSRQIHSLQVRKSSLIVEEWEIRGREYQLNNQAGEACTVLVEYPRKGAYELFDTVEPSETTDEHWRFSVEVPARSEAVLKVQERRLRSRHESVERQSFEQLNRYLRQGLMDRATHDSVVEVLRLIEQVDDLKQRLIEVEGEREKLYRSQQQMQDNMQALSTSGKEGALRARYVDQLEDSESTLAHLSQEESQAQSKIKQLEREIEQQLQRLGA